MDDEPAEARTLSVVHVYPEFGEAHTFENTCCWCHPGYDFHHGGVIVVHNVMH